ncbi:PQQ-dependent sugar dehydrogenase [Actinomadura sp. HBU206391]|uniref:PQQ-dependent sugar dehydrogenase n=1 Tax=Actinomadura sp. HBU206391 TaxID=2731692 RepID=UPI00164FC5C3|nr:PQQ-dependent sugar dehydrogenase [Actinomadura sp. HBU206391]MBC6461318.1 PQQ-dependent sugar dehydrogenase [Actinomadura sp. HBU206391]
MNLRTLSLAAVLALASLVAVPAPAPAQEDAGFDFARPQVLATGLTVPWGLAFLPDGSALVSERTSARVLQVRPDSAPVEVARLSGVQAAGEGGLLGLAVSPSYAQDGYVYAYYTAASDNRIVRFRLAASPQQEVIRSGIPRSSIHNGGRIHFGPDGMLYAGTGDGGQTANAQDWQSLGGKILRMLPDGSAPADNPRPGSVVYTLGHRNVQGLAWGGGRMYASEFGQNTWDEINHIVPGGNYGWPQVEGPGGAPAYQAPIVTWATSEASPSGATVSGSTLYAAALRGRRLWQVPLDGSGGTAGAPSAVLQDAYGRLRTVAVDPEGWLWVMTSNRDGRGTPIAADDRIVRFPPTG